VRKKHFIALADYLRDTRGYCEAFTPAQLEHLANFCHAQNCEFKRERWLDYIAGKCGKNGGSRLAPTPTEPTFDYERQAWIKDGKYVRCGHPESMDCGCYGRLHEGEAVINGR